MKFNFYFLMSIFFTVFIIGGLSGCGSRNTLTSTNIVQSEKGNFYFLFLSDVHLDNYRTRTAYGLDSGDAGQALWKAVKVKVKHILDSTIPPAFILYTGDMPQHEVGIDKRSTDLDSVLNDLKEFSGLHHTPLFYVPGNNDALGGDYCFFTDQQGKTPFSAAKWTSSYPYEAFNVAPKPDATEYYIISESNIKYGYYSAHSGNHLRLINLNSVLWSNQTCSKCDVIENCDSQPVVDSLQFAWLKQQLEAARIAKDKVYLTMHIPPGNDAFSSYKQGKTVRMWRWVEKQKKLVHLQNEFLQMVSTYKEIIAGIFFGHTHMDEFRLLYDPDDSTLINQVAISCPGISAMFSNNPGFKLIEADSITKLPNDFLTYYTQPSPIKWQEPYRFPKQPGVKPGTPILEQIKAMSSSELNNALKAIYMVKHGIGPLYDTIGLHVRMIF